MSKLFSEMFPKLANAIRMGVVIAESGCYWMVQNGEVVELGNKGSESSIERKL